MAKLGRSAGLTGFLDACREVGVDAHGLAAAVGLPADVLTNPDLRISVEAMGRMYEMAAAQSGAEDFALRVAQNRKLSNLGAVGLVMREQPTLRKALQAYTRYQWLQNDAYSLRVVIYAEQAVVQLNGPAWQQRQLADMALGTALRTLKAILGEGWKPQEVWFTHAAPRNTDSYRRLFGATPLFDQECMALVLHRDELDRAIPTADPEIARQVAVYLEQLTALRPVELTAQVGDLIVALLPEGACSVERVAQHLGVERRTLHRRLSAEGTTFSGILEEKRRELAAALLSASDRPLQNVADLLGFSSLSAFAHWFRRKFAQSASAYRAQCAETAGIASGGPATTG